MSQPEKTCRAQNRFSTKELAWRWLAPFEIAARFAVSVWYFEPLIPSVPVPSHRGSVTDFLLLLKNLSEKKMTRDAYIEAPPPTASAVTQQPV